MLNNVFVGTDISDVKFPASCKCGIEVVEKINMEDHYITIGKNMIDGIKPTNFRPLLEKGETFILPYNGEKYIKITVVS